MTEPTGGLDLPEVDTPDPLYFQQASMLMLAFRFEGTRKVIASRLLIRDDFVAELVSHLPVLDRVYADWDVSAVEIVSFQKGAFYYDGWPGAMEIVKAYRRQTAEPADESGDLPNDADPHLHDTEAA
jgi:hypothetical protein